MSGLSGSSAHSSIPTSTSILFALLFIARHPVGAAFLVGLGLYYYHFGSELIVLNFLMALAATAIVLRVVYRQLSARLSHSAATIAVVVYSIVLWVLLDLVKFPAQPSLALYNLTGFFPFAPLYYLFGITL